MLTKFSCAHVISKQKVMYIISVTNQMDGRTQ